MAFTVVTSWDFRGADSSTVKKTSRIGSYTLTEQGTPTFSSDGVTCDAAGEALTLTLPAELKFTGSYWLMCSLRRVGTVSENVTAFGYVRNNTDTPAAFNSVLFMPNSGTVGRMQGDVAGANAQGDDSASGYPSNSADSVYVLKKGPTFQAAYLGNTDFSFFNTTTDSDFTSTSHLALGCYLGVSRNPQMRFHWLLIGTGDITTGEMATIQADPDAYIYAAPPATPFRPYY